MSYERLARALLRGCQYYGPALRSLQGLPDRHRCMHPIVDAAATSAGPRPLRVLEIGAWAGASAVSWARAVAALPQKGQVVCVDAWRPYFDLRIEQDSVYAEMNDAAEQGDVFRLFLHNVRCAGLSDVVEHRVGASSHVLPLFEASSFDVIYIDGSHAAEDALEDLSHALRLIREGGILCGDDLELQRDEVDPAEHQTALASRRDFVWAKSAGTHYHPGVTESVGERLGRVFTWNGFWAARRVSPAWQPFAFEPGALPDHIADALLEEVALVEEAGTHNIVRFGSRYLAVARSLGPVSLGQERIGERELAPHILVGETLEELRRRLVSDDAHDTPGATPEV